MTELVEKQALITLISEPLKEKLKNTLREQLSDALICTRTWNAWNYGTMGEDDFQLLIEDEDYIDQLAESVLLSILDKE
jgi:hypothetical protein